MTLVKWIKEGEVIFSAADIIYMLDQHFDLFGLIESGHAIDATTIEK